MAELFAKDSERKERLDGIKVQSCPNLLLPQLQRYWPMILFLAMLCSSFHRYRSRFRLPVDDDCIVIVVGLKMTKSRGIELNKTGKRDFSRKRQVSQYCVHL